MAKSSYFYQDFVLSKEDKYSSLRNKIKEVFIESSKRYGYRRIHSVIKKTGIIISEKIVRRIMKEEKLSIPGIKKKKYNSYKGEISPVMPNLLKRNFHADKPNQKWLTDLTEFHIPAGKIYLSPIIDCFDGLPVSWSCIGTSPDATLVNTMLDKAISTLNKNERPIVHTDRGAHYRWPGWIERMKKAHLVRSMSKKGYFQYLFQLTGNQRIGERYIFPAGIWNSVRSVSHFWFGLMKIAFQQIWHYRAYLTFI